MRQGLSAATRAAWLAGLPPFSSCFCLPLFVDLGTPDLDNDEAIYSFAVDRMARATGDWLVPQSDSARGRRLPRKAAAQVLDGRAADAGSAGCRTDEFGLRFWDAVFGAASFVYVFLIGTWLLNPVCGVVAVLLLFAHAPLLFSHGLRSNTMDGAVVLAYCGGIYHYLRWIAPFDVRTIDDERSNDSQRRTTRFTSGLSPCTSSWDS